MLRPRRPRQPLPVRTACVLVIGWAASIAAYPAFILYGWYLIPSARAFDAYLLDCCEHWEALRHAELATVEHSTV